MTDSDPVFSLDTQSLRQRSVRGAAVISVSQAAKFILMLGSQILLARLLNPADFGIIAMVAPVLGFVTVMADMGLLQAIVQRPVLTRGQLNSIFWINVVLSITMALLLMALAPVLAWMYHEPRLVPVTIALASLVIIGGVSMQQAALLNRTMRYSAIAIAETLSLAAGLGVGAFAASKGLGYWSLVLNQATATIAGSLVIWAASSWRPSLPSFKSETLSMLRFGGNITISNMANYLNTVLDNVLVGFFLGEVALGLYDRAWKLAVMPLNQLMAPVNRVAIPALSQLAGEPQRYRNAFGQMLRILLFITLPGLAATILMAGPMVRLLFGAKWQGVAPVFAWLCIGGLLAPVNSAMSWIFISQGRSRDQMIFCTVTAGINVLSYVVGVHWGLVAVARTSAISVYLLQTPLLIWAASKTGPIDKAALLQILYPFVASTLAAMAAIKLYDHLVAITRLVDLAAAGALAYAASMVALACFPSGRAAIGGMAASAKSLLGSRVRPAAA